jgi:hypothetical protein
VEGIQWVNGSFVEDVEYRRGQNAPDDIDVITFAKLPDGITQSELMSRAPRIVNPFCTKEDFCVDGRIESIYEYNLEEIVETLTYWYGVWSHTNPVKDPDAFMWKGFLQVSLHPDQDQNALLLMNSAEEFTT